MNFNPNEFLMTLFVLFGIFGILDAVYFIRFYFHVLSNEPKICKQIKWDNNDKITTWSIKILAWSKFEETNKTTRKLATRCKIFDVLVLLVWGTAFLTPFIYFVAKHLISK
jgi:hypothetical protein